MKESKKDEPLTVDVVTMGCSKNLIDSERLMGMLSGSGIYVRHNPSEVKADVAVVNTCGFIGDAKEESIEMILSMIKAKERGYISRLIVMGCLSERYLKELKEELPEVDEWYGKYDWYGIRSLLLGKENTDDKHTWDRVITTLPHTAYLKISEGCNRKCAFCAIPLITGPHRSRLPEEILDEVKRLTEKGVREFNIIAQDSSSYGLDLTHKQELPLLINRIAEVPGADWIRIHYAYPAQFPLELLDVMNEKENVCKYLDIALQHISDPVLEKMRRHISSLQTIDLIRKIREKVPDIHLRTTLMVGFPGEGAKEFDELLRFVEEIRFERMGAFAYSEEENTWAAKKYEDDINPEEKQRRLDILMNLQQSISDEIQSAKVGRVLRTLIDSKEGDHYVGRTQWDSPEVDPEVIINTSNNLKPGDFAEVKISGSTAFELYGEV